MQNLSIFVFILLLLGLVFLVARNTRTRYPYRQRAQLFTPAEWRFLQALHAAMPEELLVFGKVRVADVLQPEKGLDRSTWQRSFNKIAGKHFDFVLVDADSGQMRCAIELNDRSHQRKDRQERDTFLMGACKNAHFPLLMIPTARHYDPATLHTQINQALAGDNSAPVSSNPEEPAACPFPEAGQHCPQCGSPLVERTARRGANAGRPFLSCADFPRCRYSRSL